MWHVQLGGIIAVAYEKDPKVEKEQAYDNAEAKSYFVCSICHLSYTDPSFSEPPNSGSESSVFLPLPVSWKTHWEVGAASKHC